MFKDKLLMSQIKAEHIKNDIQLLKIKPFSAKFESDVFFETEGCLKTQ